MHSPEAERFRLAFVGGTGPEGRGLALRLSQLGHSIVIGSRSRERAEEAARELSELVGDRDVTGLPNDEAAAAGEIVLLTIPYAGLRDTLRPLTRSTQEKIVVSCVAPVEFREGRPFALRVEAGSAAQEVQELLPDSRVVSAFQTVDAHQLQDLDAALDTDVIICSDDVEARRAIVRLANELPGVRALSGGRLSSSRYVEECTALLITINRIYKVHSGIRLTGINR
jgi:NADPH-dependent F420 reductase